MEAKQIEGLIELGLGVLVLLMAAGVVPVSKNRDANVAWLRKYRWIVLLAGLFLLVRGGTYVARLYW